MTTDDQKSRQIQAALRGDVLDDSRAATLDVSRNARLRADAMLAYVTAATPISIANLADDPRFLGVSQRTLERWSTADRWPERRATFVQRYAEEMREKIGSDLVRARIDEGRVISQVYQRACELLLDEDVRPRSFEGVVKALLDMGARRDVLATDILAELMPKSGRAVALGEVPVDMGDAELDAATDAILAQRREANAITAAQTGEVAPGEATMKTCRRCGFTAANIAELDRHDCDLQAAIRDERAATHDED